MSKLREKQNEVRCKRNRESILNNIAGEFRGILEVAEFSCDKDKLKYGAWSTWKEGQWTTTRGNITSWIRKEYETWEEVVSAISTSKVPVNEQGWLVFSPEGPYFKIEWYIFKRYLSEIEIYAARHESFDIAWLGDKRDFGLITEYNPTSDGKLEFELCKWGL